MHWGPLYHRIAWEGSERVLKLFEGCIREEEHKDAFIEVYQVFKAALDIYDANSNRRLLRWEPSVN